MIALVVAAAAAAAVVVVVVMTLFGVGDGKLWRRAAMRLNSEDEDQNRSE